MLTSVIFCVLSLVPHFVIKPSGCRSVDAKKRAHAILVRMLRDRSYFWLHVLIIFSQTNLANASKGEWFFLQGCSGKKMCKPHKHWTYRCILDTCNIMQFQSISCYILSIFVRSAVGVRISLQCQPHHGRIFDACSAWQHGSLETP